MLSQLSEKILTVIGENTPSTLRGSIIEGSSGINPFMASGFFYHNTLDWSISYIRGVRLVFIIIMFCRNF